MNLPASLSTPLRKKCPTQPQIVVSWPRKTTPSAASSVIVPMDSWVRELMASAPTLQRDGPGNRRWEPIHAPTGEVTLMITYSLSPAIPSMSKASIPDPRITAGDIGDIDKVQTSAVRTERWLMFSGLFAPLSMYYWTGLTRGS